MADDPPTSPLKEEPSARMRALKTRLSAARSELTASHRAVTEHLRKYPKSIQPITSAAGRAEHPEIAQRLMADSEVKQREYDNAFEEYVQAIHDEHMRAADENNKAMVRLARLGTAANWAMVVFTIILAITAAAQIYYLSKQANQPPSSPVVNVAPPVVNVQAPPQPTVIVHPTIVVPSAPKP